MNHIYRSIWNATLGAWVAVSEITQACGKRKLRGIASVKTPLNSRLRRLNTALVLAGLLAVPSSGFAQSTGWTGGAGDGDWSTGGNWNSGVPTAETRVLLNNPSDQITLNASGAAQTLEVEGPSEVIVTTGGELVISDLVSLGRYRETGVAKLTINSGGTVSAARLFAGDGLPQGIVTVTGAGSSLTVAPQELYSTHRFLIGGSGAGELHIDAGANVTVNGTRILHLGGSASGTLFIGNGAGAGTLTAGSVIFGTTGSSVQFNHTGTTTFAAAISGGGFLTKTGAGTTILTGTNSYTGGTLLQGGSIVVGNDSALGSSAVSVQAGTALNSTTAVTLGNAFTLNGGFTVDGSGNLGLSGVLSGTGSLTKSGSAALILSGSNTYSGGTILNGGTLVVGNNTALGFGAVSVEAGTSLSSSTGVTLGNAFQLGRNYKLTIDGSNNLGFSGAVTGEGQLIKNGAGELSLSGVNTYTGNTTVNSGRLIVASGGSLASGLVNVASGATLGGSGSLAGDVTVASGATLAPGSSNGMGSLTVGSLTMAKDSKLNVALGAPGTNFQTPGQGTSVHVTGNLALDGAVLNVSDTGSFGPGLYRLFDFNGALVLSNGGLTTSAAGTSVQILSGSRQINLINTKGMTLNFWNANGLASDNTQGGGSGSWSNTSASWTDAKGSVTSTMSPQPGFAIFGGAAGAVTLDGSGGNVQATGLQFASDGYLMSGGALTLVADATRPSPVEVRVGDGSAASSDYVATLNNEIAGSDGLKKAGQGTLVLNGVNTYSGGTTVASGTLSVSSNANLGNTSDTLTLNGGTLKVTGTSFNGNGSRNWVLGSTGGGINIDDLAHSFTLSSALTGAGVFHKTGLGSLRLTGANSYAGGTSIEAGILALEAEGSLAAAGAVHVADGATFDIAASNNAQTIGSLSGAAGSRVMLGTQALTFGDAGPSTFSGDLSGSGNLIKQGAGIVQLDGNSSAFAGTTLVNAGSLILGSAGVLGGNLTVAKDAQLMGTGAVGSIGSQTTIQNGATLVAGNGANDYGTLQVLGNLTMESGSILEVKASANSAANSLVDVAGKASLNGGVLHVGNEANASTDYQVGKTYTILQAAGGVSGEFDTVGSNFAYLDAKLGYTDKNVDLTLQRKTSGGGNTGGNTINFADFAESVNQAAVANAIESMSSTSPLYRFIETLPNGAPAAAFNSLSGDAHANIQAGLRNLSSSASSLGSKRLHSNLTAGYRPGAAIAQSSGSLPASAWPTSKALPAWAEVVGHRQSIDGDGNAAKLTQNVYGLFIGADEEVGGSGWRVGGSLGFTKADTKTQARDASADTKSYSASVYTGKGFSHGANRVNVLGGLAYTHHRIDSQRTVAGLGQNLKAKYSAHTTQLFGEVGYAMGQYDQQGIEPFVGINVSQQRVGSFQETGGFAALRGSSSSDTFTSTTLGVRAHSDIKLAGKDTRLKGTVGWRHAFGDVKQTATLAFEGSNNFTVTGVPLSRNTALLGLQAEIELGRRAALELGYQGEYGSGTRDNAVNVKVRWAY